jgi:hypothetical protein
VPRYARATRTTMTIHDISTGAHTLPSNRDVLLSSNYNLPSVSVPNVRPLPSAFRKMTA